MLFGFGDSQAGEFTANGASPSGTITGTEDIGAPTGASSVSVSSTYSISSAPTNGRGTFTGSVGGSHAIVYVVSSSKFVVMSTSDSNPAVLMFEK